MNSWHNLVEAIYQHHWGDIASVAGIFVSILGFFITILNVVRSKKAAEQAKEAARQARESMFKFDLVQDLAAASTTMEEIKRLHRAGVWAVLPDRYSSLRKLLLSVSMSTPALSQHHKSALLGVITQLRDIEKVVERSIETNDPPAKVAKLNEIVSDQADKLHSVMVEIRSIRV